ncbi:MAG TPA: alpha/beta hydrolase [Micromonosporaceae bacterium]|nr:alpha/beta hydrolase [Micromonosporaceae bacterium]
MPTFSSYDGTVLSYRLEGTGPLVICVPGGPARDSRYFGDLGGLSACRTLLLLDNRGTGESGDAADPSDVESYRADRLVEDVEALRKHLGLETFDLLGHSAGAHVSALYAAEYPHRLSSLTLITGGHRAAGTAIDGAAIAHVDTRVGEPWYAEARPALDQWFAIGRFAPDELKLKASPFFYGNPWDDVAKAHAESDPSQRRNPDANANFPYEPDPSITREKLAKVTAPVLVYAGELDPSPRPEEAEKLAAVFPNARLVVQPNAGHFPWLNDPVFFTQALTGEQSR